MEIVWTIAGGIAGIGLGILGGFKAGERVQERPSWVYWLLNGTVFVVGCAVTTVGLILGWDWLYVMGVALIGGGFTGLKYGYGKSVGLWRVHDTWMRSDEDMRD